MYEKILNSSFSKFKNSNTIITRVGGERLTGKSLANPVKNFLVFNFFPGIC